MAKETAEQKLLKLIEQTQSQQPAPASAPVAASPSVTEAQKVFQSVSSVNVSGVGLPQNLLNSLNFFKNLMGSKSQGFGLKEFNTLFIILIIFFGIFFALDLTKGMERSQIALRKLFTANNARTWGTQGMAWVQADKPFNVYAELFSKRNIFQPYEEKVAKKAEQVEEEKNGIGLIAVQAKDLKLVGISWLDTPQSASAMIENTATGNTFFLGEGDTVSNVTVKKIFADSIVIGYGQEEMELRL